MSSRGETNGFIESKVTFNELTEELILEYVKTGMTISIKENGVVVVED